MRISGKRGEKLMPDITRRDFFRLASVVGGAVVFNIEVKQPFAKLLAEKIMRHPAARQVDVAGLCYFDYNHVVVRAIYWSDKHQRKLYQFARLDRELYLMSAGSAAKAAAEACATKLFAEAADYELEKGPFSAIGDSLVADFVASEWHRLMSGSGSGGEPIGLL